MRTQIKPQMNLSRELLKTNLSVRIKAKGSSMRPVIRTGEYITINPARWQELKIGDIIAYSNKGHNTITCHRLIRIEDSYLITKGDAHIWGYERVSFDSLLGKVICIERGKQKIDLETNLQRTLAHKIAWFSLHLPLLLVIAGYAIEVFRAPHLAPLRLIRKIRRGRIFSRWTIS